MKYKSEANCVEKKDFAKGFLSGVLVVVLLVTAVKSFSVVQGIFSTNMSAETKIKTIQKYIDKYYVEEYDKKDMEEMMYTGLVTGLGDPYTSYIPADDLQNFIDDTKGEFVGIGIEYTKDISDGNILVATVMDGSPAEKAGMRPNDKIVKIEGESVAPMDTQEIQNKMSEHLGITAILDRAVAACGKENERTWIRNREKHRRRAAGRKTSRCRGDCCGWQEPLR